MVTHKGIVMSKEVCKHQGDGYPSYDHYVCSECGSIKTDSHSSWGIAKNTWFKSVDEARFYKKHGRLPEKVN